MTSCELLRTAAYSEDIRCRMVLQHLALGYSHERVAQNIGVDRSTVSNIIQLFYTTGAVAKKVYPKDKAYRKLTTTAPLLIVNLVFKNPRINLKEIQEELLEVSYCTWTPQPYADFFTVKVSLAKTLPSCKTKR